MGRRYEIEAAFSESLKITKRGWVVETREFVSNLAKYNWLWTLKEANNWIEIHKHNFRDISTEEGEARTFHMFDPHGR
ncbi:DNA polymerase V [Enterobacterales bacterium CwR94]|nr:DNA polymerase V [Enterobacterales bacterium CwR94]